MNNHHLVRECKAIIAKGESAVSEVTGFNEKYSYVPFSMFVTGIVYMPAYFTGTKLYFKVATAGSETFVDAINDKGNLISISVLPGKATILPSSTFEAFSCMRPVLTNSEGVAQNQAEDVVMTFVMKT